MGNYCMTKEEKEEEAKQDALVNKYVNQFWQLSRTRLESDRKYYSLIIKDNKDMAAKWVATFLILHHRYRYKISG